MYSHLIHHIGGSEESRTPFDTPKNVMLEFFHRRRKRTETYLVTLDGARDGVDGRRDALTGVDVVE